METSKISQEFGLASDLFWDPLGENEIKAAAEHGFSFLEIWGHLPWFDIYSSSMASELRTMVEAHGLSVRSVHAPCEGDWDVSSEDEAVRRKSVDEVILSIKNCREMGGRVVVVHPGRVLVSEGDTAKSEHDRRIKQSAKSFRDIQKAGRDSGAMIAVENQWAKEVGGTEEHFLRLLGPLDPQSVGICFDSSHANITPGTLEMFQRIKHPIITTHLSDNHGTYDEHRPPFTAAVDWRKVLKFLVEKDFRGPWLLEVTNGGNDPLEVLAKMQNSIERMKVVITEISSGA